jgi:hypothetical protein
MARFTLNWLLAGEKTGETWKSPTNPRRNDRGLGGEGQLHNLENENP